MGRCKHNENWKNEFSFIEPVRNDSTKAYWYWIYCITTTSFGFSGGKQSILVQQKKLSREDTTKVGGKSRKAGGERTQNHPKSNQVRFNNNHKRRIQKMTAKKVRQNP